MDRLKSYRWAILLMSILIVVYFVNNELGARAVTSSLSNLKAMFMLIPPIFIMMGLMDVWVPKEFLIKYMGHESGITGLLIAFILGTAAAGPIYVAFPIGQLLLKKGARLAYVIFFLGVWSSTKLTIILFEIASLGLKFTMIQIGVSLPLYLIVAYLIEKSVSTEAISAIVSKVE
jgi:uncharacterized membrane protein YraQ (UPF0718 family)